MGVTEAGFTRTMRSLAALALLTLSPQSWEPFAARREVSPGGRHYAVLGPSRDGKGVRYELVRRREGAAPLPPARALPVTASPAEKPPDIERDPADATVASGDLPQLPFQVRVLDREPGLVLFEQYGALGRGDALALLGPDGRFRWRLALGDLFRAEAVAKFPREGSDVWWFEAWWVDEERGVVVLCAVGDHLGEVALADGKVRKADPAVLLSRAASGPPEDRVAAMEIAARLLPPGVEALAAKVLSDPDAPPALRIRAAAALQRKTGEVVAQDLVARALARGVDPAARVYAAQVAGELLGEGAIPLLREVLRGEADEAWRPAMASLVEIGPKAIPVLVEMLGEKDQSLDYRGGAASVLGLLRAEAALPALWKAALEFDPAKDEFHFVAQSALEAVAAIGPPDLRARLLEVLDRGTPHDGRIAQWIEGNPGKEAIPSLKKARERWGEFSWERKRIEAALKACGE